MHIKSLDVRFCLVGSEKGLRLERVLNAMCLLGTRLFPVELLWGYKCKS